MNIGDLVKPNFGTKFCFNSNVEDIIRTMCTLENHLLPWTIVEIENHTRWGTLYQVDTHNDLLIYFQGEELLPYIAEQTKLE